MFTLREFFPLFYELRSYSVDMLYGIKYLALKIRSETVKFIKIFTIN